MHKKGFLGKHSHTFLCVEEPSLIKWTVVNENKRFVSPGAPW